MGVRRRLVWVLAGLIAMGASVIRAQTAKTSAPLENTHWKLEWMPGAKIEAVRPQQTAFIELDSRSQRMNGSGGCNRLTGGYEMEGDHLRFPGVARTMMACRGMQSEDELVDTLDKVREWKVTGSTLSLLDTDGHVLARFVAAPQ